MPIPTTEELARLAAAEPQGADVEFTTPPSLWDERLYAWLMAMKEHGLSFESLDEESHARAIKMIENVRWRFTLVVVITNTIDFTTEQERAGPDRNPSGFKSRTKAGVEEAA